MKKGLNGTIESVDQIVPNPKKSTREEELKESDSF